jgi:hypothetical protein
MKSTAFAAGAEISKVAEYSNPQAVQGDAVQYEKMKQHMSNTNCIDRVS